MVKSRRDVLQNMQVDSESTNASLWLDKYINQDVADEGVAKKQLVEDVCKIEVSPIYESYIIKRNDFLESVGALSKKATVSNRMAINLGAESVLETDIALDATFGVPYIPGSALKGLAAFYARTRFNKEEWGNGSKAYQIVFGDSDEAGYITFFDAFYEPNTGYKNRALHADIMTPHHTDYNQGKQDSVPADWDSPTPINFLTATGSYKIFLLGDNEWVKVVFEILELALKELGIGAKTSSGYGKMFFGEKVDYSEYYEIPNFQEEMYRLLKEIPMNNRKRNIIRLYRKTAGYGFLKTKANGRDIYFEDSFFRDEKESIEEGCVVEYTLGKNDRGQPQAWDIVVLLAPY